MNDIQLLHFLTVIECESFSRAAEKLFVSQSAVSKQIRSLEETWGVTLFSRERRGVALTPAGRFMYEKVRLSQIALEQVLHQAKELDQAHKKAFLRLGLFERCNLKGLPYVLSTYAMQNQSVSLDCENGNFYTLQQGLYSQKYDLILTLQSMLPNQKVISVLPIAKARHIAYISRCHPLATKPQLSFRDLRELSFYVPTFQSNNMTGEHATSICSTHGFTPPEVKLVPNVESALMAVRIGKGAVILDSCVDISASEELLGIPTDLYTSVVLAWLKDSQNKQIADLAQHIVAQYRSLSTLDDSILADPT